MPITDLYLQVFQRCQREVGRLWQLNQLTVALFQYALFLSGLDQCIHGLGWMFRLFRLVRLGF